MQPAPHAAIAGRRASPGHSRTAETMTGARIYNLFPLLAGDVASWHAHLPRIAAMAFDWIYVNPFHFPGFSGSLYAVKDPRRLHPLLDDGSGRTTDEQLAALTEAAKAHGLRVMMDLVVNHTSKDSPLVERHPEWFVRGPDGAVQSPHAIDPADARRITVWGDLAELDYRERLERVPLVAHWRELVRHFASLGFAGFRCDAAYKVPGPVWADLIAAAREIRPDAVFAAETLGCRIEEVTGLQVAGFDYLFNSSKWWDFQAPWLLEQYNTFRHIAPSIAFPESHDTPRLVAELAERGITDPDEVARIYRQRYLFAATFSTAVMMPMGFEFGFAHKLDVVRTRPEDWEEPRFDLSSFIAEVNRTRAALPALNEEGPMRRLDSGGAIGLLRTTHSGDTWALTLVNPCREAVKARLDGLPGDAIEVTPDRGGRARLGSGRAAELGPGDVRLFVPAETARMADGGTRGGGASLVDTVRSRPIVIERVTPEIDGGRYPVKRVVGDQLTVEATLFKEGHDKLAAVVRYRRVDESVWHERAMEKTNAGLDRWRAHIPLEANTRYQYTIEVWRDVWGTWCDATQKKLTAGQDVRLELAEGRALLAETADRARGDDRALLQDVLRKYDAIAGAEQRATLLLASRVAHAMQRHADRSDAVHHDRDLEVVVDRERAVFGAWYELFPRSQGTVPGRSATFRECERRLPEIRQMGFDVVYLPPIHPIGRTHRKGPDNTLEAGPDDPGSPYAIGAREGGHDAVHPELGTLDDFRRFVAAVREHGMEVALDFAIQCSPDHPWIQQHPEWFRFRPDGSIKYAENPPKKYQDIVNVEFYGPHQDALWRELLRVVRFWVDEGVRIFRVDNPHTKPVPFWEWLIGSVQRTHPDVIFLSEAFTRPPMLQMLAKVGFTQSYTYFTWRNFKQELTEYLTELTQGESREYLRPNFFANTPDILPRYLQEGGRPAFRVRLVLAGTLSSVYGIYSGFELCENRAVPNSEEYLHSEKYEYKVWDWDRPGHIKADVARLNRIRFDNPALQRLDTLHFLPASDDDVLFYGKWTEDASNVVLCAVNLNPYDVAEAVIELPLDVLGIAENETFEVEELMGGTRHLWHGRKQRLRLDPRQQPAMIFRVNRWVRVHHREPCD